MTKRTTVLLRTGIALATTSLVVASCSGSREDVRVSFCKSLTATQVASPSALRWTAVETRAGGHSGLTVVLGFESGGEGRPRQATCHYRYNAVEDTALTLSDPLSVYSTSPETMTLDGESLSRPALARAVKQAMIDQGKALIDRAQQGIEDAAAMARDRFGSGNGN
ncbi:hypothetical protein [Thiocapsa marina]|uniref:Lipoprotein n=1 Tax=Thiocapsa marina 5811 TaxID=768671 RepID=F9UCP7_9GAMM|nr:hypothetical protein [Thiocapsa marina]EGV18160.1 hypothetical protein ThimaDRAFT_2699 [Thiocapsa marina 5811]